jgi:MFS family permease
MPTAAPDQANSPGRGIQTFHALHHRNFRMLWLSLTVSAVGTWMQIVALSLLVLKLTHGSAIALGELSLTQALAFLLSAPIAGGIADRFDKRRLLIVTQSLLMLLALLLGFATYSGAIQFWMVLAIAFLAATILSVDQPARFVLLPSLVPPEDLMNALSLQAAVFNGAAMVGPTVAGLMINWIGLAGDFFLNGASFVAVLIALMRLRPPSSGSARETRRGSLIASVAEAIRSVRNDAALPAILIAYGLLLFCGPSPALLLPVFATKILRIDPTGLGLLFSALGAGTIVGALLAATIGDRIRKGYLLWAGYLAWSIAVAEFAISRDQLAAMATLGFVGIAQSLLSATTITLMQTRVPAPMRGRVMSLNTMLLMGVRPLGDFPASAAIALIGVRSTALLAAGIVGVGALYVLRPSDRTAPITVV